MPVINDLKNRNNEPVYINKSEWLLKVSNGEINHETKTLYIIKDDYVDPGSGASIKAGEGIIYISSTGTISVDKEWLKDTVNTMPNIDANTIDGYGISTAGETGLVLVNELGETHIGQYLFFHNGSIIGKLYICNDGSIGSQYGFTGDIHGTADKAIGDQEGNNIRNTYVKKIEVSNGNIVYTYGNGTTATVPLPAGTAYTGGTGISVNGSIITNTGVTSIAEGTTNGTIQVTINGSSPNVKVHGIDTAAYRSDTYFALSDHVHNQYSLASHNHDQVYAPINHTHYYAGSSSVGGAATNANYANSTLAGTSSGTGDNYYYTNCLRNIGFGTRAADTTTCPSGALYGTHE